MALPQNSGNFVLHGRFYTTPQVTDAGEVGRLANSLKLALADPAETKRTVWILSGTHGTSSGELAQEKDFFFEDKMLEGQTFKAVNVFGFTTDTATGQIVRTRWQTYLDKTGLIILAWCFSEYSRTGWMKKLGLLT